MKGTSEMKSIRPIKHLKLKVNLKSKIKGIIISEIKRKNNSKFECNLTLELKIQIARSKLKGIVTIEMKRKRNIRS